MKRCAANHDRLLSIMFAQDSRVAKWLNHPSGRNVNAASMVADLSREVVPTVHETRKSSSGSLSTLPSFAVYPPSWSRGLGIEEPLKNRCFGRLQLRAAGRPGDVSATNIKVNHQTSFSRGLSVGHPSTIDVLAVIHLHNDHLFFSFSDTNAKDRITTIRKTARWKPIQCYDITPQARPSGHRLQEIVGQSFRLRFQPLG